MFLTYNKECFSKYVPIKIPTLIFWSCHCIYWALVVVVNNLANEHPVFSLLCISIRLFLCCGSGSTFFYLIALKNWITLCYQQYLNLLNTKSLFFLVDRLFCLKVTVILSFQFDMITNVEEIQILGHFFHCLIYCAFNRHKQICVQSK